MTKAERLALWYAIEKTLKSASLPPMPSAVYAEISGSGLAVLKAWTSDVAGAVITRSMGGARTLDAKGRPT
jgi:hypothetical protein